MFDFIFNPKKEKHKTETESFICDNCGSQMEMYEDRYGHRKLICENCKSVKDVIETEEERYERVMNDIRIKQMKEQAEHPLKMVKELIPFALFMLFVFGMCYLGSILFPD